MNKQVSIFDLKNEIKEFSKKDDDLHIFIERMIEARMEAIQGVVKGIIHDIGNCFLSLSTSFSTLMIKLKDSSRSSRESFLPLEDLKRIELLLDRTNSLLQELKQVFFSFEEHNDVSVCDLSANIKKNLDTLYGFLKPGVSLEFKPSSLPLPVYLRDDELWRILSNLVINAVEAMETGLVEIITEFREITESEAKLHGNARPGEYALLICRDNGKGISKEDLSHIFEPSFSSKNDSQGNRGLGLTAVYYLMKKRNGWIHVESEINKGTTFELYFPLVKT